MLVQAIWLGRCLTGAPGQAWDLQRAHLALACGRGAWETEGTATVDDEAGKGGIKVL